MTPHKYHMRKKMDVAKVLLSTTEMFVREISASLGFSDEFYFSTAFKRETQRSPLAYRRMPR